MQNNYNIVAIDQDVMKYKNCQQIINNYRLQTNSEYIVASTTNKTFLLNAGPSHWPTGAHSSSTAGEWVRQQKWYRCYRPIDSWRVVFPSTLFNFSLNYLQTLLELYWPWNHMIFVQQEIVPNPLSVWSLLSERCHHFISTKLYKVKFKTLPHSFLLVCLAPD